MSPLLSVTILNYNYASYVGDCLASLLAQNNSDAVEFIVIDDCSTDKSLEVIRTFCQDPRVRLISHTVNQGYVSSLLEGVELSKGKYISVVSADDVAVCADGLARQVSLLEEHSDVSFVYSAWNQIDERGAVSHKRSAHTADGVFSGIDEFAALIESSDVLHSGTVIRRSAYDAVGGYNRDCRYSVDTNMWLALCSQGGVGFVADPLFAYRAHGGNLSASSGAVWRATEEMLLGIDRAIALFGQRDRNRVESLRMKAIQRALLSVPTVDIFAGRTLRGWKAYWQAARRYPRLVVTQRRTLALVSRSILGQRGFDRVRSLAPR